MLTGETLTSGKGVAAKVAVEQLAPVYRLGIEAADRKDEVKLTAAIGKLREEDPSLHFEQNAELHEMCLAGQGEIHLKVAHRRADFLHQLTTRLARTKRAIAVESLNVAGMVRNRRLAREAWNLFQLSVRSAAEKC